MQLFSDNICILVDFAESSNHTFPIKSTPEKYTFPIKSASEKYTFPIKSHPEKYTFPKNAAFGDTKKTGSFKRTHRSEPPV